jgi:hypothetical protein
MMGWDHVSELRPPKGLFFNSVWYVSMEGYGDDDDADWG